MGQELYQTEPIMKATFDEASEVLGYSVADLCFEESETERLKSNSLLLNRRF